MSHKSRAEYYYSSVDGVSVVIHKLKGGDYKWIVYDTNSNVYDEGICPKFIQAHRQAFDAFDYYISHQTAATA